MFSNVNTISEHEIHGILKTRTTLTITNTSIVPEEPNANKIHKQVRHCRNDQVMPAINNIKKQVRFHTKIRTKT